MRRGGGLISAVVLTVGVATLAAPTASAAPTPLNGLFSITGGVCSGDSVNGSFFRMILPAGDRNGPFLSNSDSTCSDKTVTPLAAGSSGGLTSGTFQPQPAEAFDGTGNAVSGSVTTPVKFYGVGFATATNETDPQTGQGAGVPQIQIDGDQLSGDLSSFGVTWNRQVFNQGAPKPGGGLPGKTSAVSGSIDRSTGAYVLEWTSQIVGGPFNNFTGLWHLSGIYQGDDLQGQPAAAQSAAPAPPAAPGTSAPAAPGAAPSSAPAPAPAGQDPAAAQVAPQAAQQSGDPSLAVQTVDVPASETTPRWLLPVLVVITAIAAGVLTNIDRLFRRRSDE